MRVLLAVIAVTGVFFLASCVGGEKPESGPPEARLATVQVVKGSPKLRVPFALTNPSKATVSYALEGGDLYNLWGELYQDGKLVARPVTIQPVPFDKEWVRQLKPNETVRLVFDLGGKVEPGKYELRLTYEIRPKSVEVTKYGLTQMKLEQTILLDVRGE